MIRFTQNDLDSILAEFLGKPYQRGAAGPDAFDCYGLARAFMARVGVEIADIGKVDPKDSRPVYERQQTDYIRLPVPRSWSLVTFSSHDLNAHIGVVLPGDGMFLHCPGRAAGKVIAEPLTRRPWRDSIDGYWWPKGWIETVVMLTPMSTTKRAWQFVRAGRCLAEIIEQDITEGRDVQVQAFLGGELVPQERWLDVVPTEMDQIVIRPVMASGKQAAMAAGMLALAVLAPYAAGALVPAGTPAAVAAGTATAGATFSYNLAAAAIMMGGGLALNALVGANEGDHGPSQHYSAEPQTTAEIGAKLPLVYGTYGVRGVLLCSYATSTCTTETHIFLKETLIRHASDLYHIKVAYSDGPIQGIVPGTEKINDRDVDYYSGDAGFMVEHFTGTDDQAASSIPDAFEIPVSLECPTGEAITKTFTAVDCDSVALVLRFPNGMTDYAADGTHSPTEVQLKAEVRIAGGSWHTLMNGSIWGDSKDPLRYSLNFASTYEGGSPFSIVAGTEYEARVTRLSNTHSDKGDSFLFDCIQFGYATAQKHPGIAYTAIGAVAGRDISGSIQYYAKIHGKLVRVYDPDTETWSIEWSDNPAWVAYDVLTRPVIAGNGTTVPYYVEYYRRLDPSYLNLDDFVALADWCDQMVPDGNGGTEKRYVFNGVFDDDGSAWDQAIRVCRMACAAPFFRGHRVGIVIDKPGLPSQMFNVSNLRSGFSETWIDTSEAATVFDVRFANEQGEYEVESYPVPLAGATRDIPATLDGFGCTKRSQAYRRATRDLRVNQHMKRTVEIPACLDAVYTDLGQIVYVQHPALNRAFGGRILEVYSDGVKVDKPVTEVPPGALAHYRFNDCAANKTVTDISGNGRHGTASHNTDTMSVDGKINTALRFVTASSRWVAMANDASLWLASGGYLSMWVKWSGTYANSGGAAPRLYGRIGGPNIYARSDGSILLRMDGGTTGRDTVSAAGVLVAGQWKHVVVSITADKRIYVDGVDVTIVQGDSRLPATTGLSYIGAYTTSSGFFDGDIDDVRVYAGEPTQSGIALLYNLGNGTEAVSGSSDWALLVRTHDGTDERLSLYSVAGVEGEDRDIIRIDGVWEYTPNPNDLWTFGDEERVVDLYRVKGIERSGDGKVLIRGTQYTTDFYAEDENAPKIQAKVYSQTKGGRSKTLTPTTAEAIKANLPDGASTLDSLMWEGLAFAGNGVDTVTWTCSSTGGAGIKYQGVWVPIYDDATGTTDRYVYFDPNVGDPRYLHHTDNIEDLAGQERYVFCINENGVPNFRPGELIGPDEVKLDGIEPGADVTQDSPVDAFRDTFDDPQNNVATRWVKIDGGGSLSIYSDGVAGGKSLKVTNPLLGNGEAYLIYHKSVAYDTSKLYRLRVRVKRTGGSGTCYFGVVGRNSDDTQYVNCDGNNLIANQHWVAGNGVAPGSDWTVYTGYFTGQSGSADPGWYSDPTYPGALHSNVYYFRPAMIVGYHNEPGTILIDEFSIDIVPEQVQEVNPTVFSFGAYGDDDHDDTQALQAAIDYAITTGRPWVLPQPAVAYKISDTLNIGNGLSVVAGFRLQTEGSALIRWYGGTGKTMVNILSVAEGQFNGLALDGRSTSGVNGIYLSTGSGRPAQNNTFRHLWVQSCPGVGVTIEHTGTETTDYVMLENPSLQLNGVNLKVMGGTRQCIVRGGRLLDATTYNIYLYDAMVECVVPFFAGAGTSDIYLGSQITAIKCLGGGSESNVILTCASGAGSGSRLLGGCAFINFQQSAEPAPTGNVMEYNIWQPLTLVNCKFQNNINIGSSASTVKAIDVDFIAGGFTGTGLENKVVRIGGGGSNYFQIGPLLVGMWGGSWPSGVAIRNIAQNRYIGLFMSESVPDSYYHVKGDIVLNCWAGTGDPIGWRCTASGDGDAHTTKAVFEPIAGATDFIKSLMDDGDAATARTTLGVGTGDTPQFSAVNVGHASDTTLARASAGDLSVEGNLIYRAGGTDVPVADGGTGASDAATARTNLGLGTAHSPQFAAVNIGHASDTTLTRASAGNLAVEGNLMYRAGGTDVPVADGGTGASDAAAARTNLGIGSIATQNANSVNISGGSISGITDLAVADGGTGASTAAGAQTNLGLGTGDSPQFAGINVGHASDTTITRVSAGNIAVEGKTIYRVDGTDVAVADGGTGASTAAAARTNLGIGSIATLADTVTAKSTNYSVQESDSGKWFTNTGASGSTALTLPTASAGLVYGVIRAASQAFWIKPASGEQFRGQVANKYLELTSNGMSVVVKCNATGIWDIVAAGIGTTAWMGP